MAILSRNISKFTCLLSLALLLCCTTSVKASRAVALQQEDYMSYNFNCNLSSTSTVHRYLHRAHSKTNVCTWG